MHWKILQHFSFRSPESLDLLSSKTIIVVCQKIYIFNFLKTTEPIVTIFGLQHLYGIGRILNCEINGSTTYGTSRQGQICKKSLIFTKSSLLPHMLWKKSMYDNDVLKAPYQNCEIHGPLIWHSNPRVGPIWHIVKMYLILENLLLYSHTIYLKKLNAWLWFSFSPLPTVNCKLYCQRQR